MATDSPHIAASFIEAPPRDLDRKPEIKFLHPGYRRYFNMFLTLPRVDSETSDDTVIYGVHHKTALIACQIIAGNVFHTGYFASDNAGLQRENVSLDGLLTKDSYYFIVEGNDNYPIVPSFKDWQFPHEEIRNIWPDVSSHDLNATYCGITKVDYAINRAHLLPQEELAWYYNNVMRTYGDINCVDNILPLCKNLHKCFDDRWFAIVPKLTTGGMQYVSHILAKQESQLWPTYQNIIVRGLTSAHKPFLFARFAWAVLLRVKPFVTQTFSCQVIRVHTDDRGVIEYKDELMTGIQLQSLYGGGGSKSATPLKRKMDSRDELEGLENDSSEEEAEAGDDVWDTGYEQGFPVRSAKRRQQTSSESFPDDKPTLSREDKIALEMSIGDMIASQIEQESMEE